jgi:hypothetical protein
VLARAMRANNMKSSAIDATRCGLFAWHMDSRHRALPINASPAWRDGRSSDFEENFAKRIKCLCANFRVDTLALVTPQDNNHSCEQLVNRCASAFAPRLTFSAGSRAPRACRPANLLVACATMITNHFHRSTEVFYAPTCLPKLVSPHHFFPAAPL